MPTWGENCSIHEIVKLFLCFARKLMGQKLSRKTDYIYSYVTTYKISALG
jgi:hypothetical protein